MGPALLFEAPRLDRKSMVRPGQSHLPWLLYRVTADDVWERPKQKTLVSRQTIKSLSSPLASFPLHHTRYPKQPRNTINPSHCFNCTLFNLIPFDTPERRTPCLQERRSTVSNPAVFERRLAARERALSATARTATDPEQT